MAGLDAGGDGGQYGICMEAVGGVFGFGYERCGTPSTHLPFGDKAEKKMSGLFGKPFQ